MKCTLNVPVAAALRLGLTAMGEMQLSRDCFDFCRGLFATHYHRLADAHEQDTKVAICHMGCSVEPGTNGCPEQVTTQNTPASGLWLHRYVE